MHNDLIQRIKDHKEETHALRMGIRLAIKLYVDKPFDSIYVSSDLDTINLTIDGISFWVYSHTSITEIKAEGCNKTMPTTAKEFQELLESNARRIKTVRQAYLMFKYLT